MSSTLLEVTRSAHEDVERLERLVVRDLQREPASNRVRLFQNHRVRNMIDTIISTTDKLIEIYEDKDNARKDEISVLGGQTASGGIDVFSAFYDRLKEALAARGLKTGGTVLERAEKLFLTKHTPLDKLDRKHFAKNPCVFLSKMVLLQLHRKMVLSKKLLCWKVKCRRCVNCWQRTPHKQKEILKRNRL